MTVPAESVEQDEPVADTGPASFATAEEMLRKRKREVVVNDSNDDEDVEVKDTSDDDGDDETDDTSDDDGDEETDDTSDYRCKDCGFLVDLFNHEDHEFCEGNVWNCGRCGKVARTVS